MKTRMHHRILRLVPLLAIVAGLSACGREKTPQDLGPFIDGRIWNLVDKEFTVRRSAARALGRIGPGASKAVPALVCALDDEDRTVREAAALALDRIEPGARRLVIAGRSTR